MDKLDMFQDIFDKMDRLGWWGLEIISADAGTQFTSTEFQDKCQTRSINITLADPEHQEMNVQVKLTWITLHTISHSLMVRARFSEAYINFALMYTEYHILPVLPIKDLINDYGEVPRSEPRHKS